MNSRLISLGIVLCLLGAALSVSGCTGSQVIQPTPQVIYITVTPSPTPQVVNVTSTPQPTLQPTLQPTPQSTLQPTQTQNPTPEVANVTATPTPSPTPSPTPTPIPSIISAATDASYPPFETINGGGYVGFDIDIMNAIAANMNRQAAFSNIAFSNIITAVQNNQYNCGIAAITVTADRQQYVSFSDEYYENRGQVILTKVGSPIQGPADLVGRNVGAERGTVAYNAVLGINGFNSSNLSGYVTMPDAYAALQNGNVDAVAGDYAVMYPFMKQNPSVYTIAPNGLTQPVYFGIVVNKNNPLLLAAINQALANIKADGQYQQIYNKWFG